MEDEMKIKENKTILIVDDELPIRDVLSCNLKREGYNIIEAADGMTAVDMALEQKPDLILLDIMLPKLDGLSVCKRIKNSLNIPIIMLSAKDGEIDKILGLELGADDYITKPFAIEELLARIRVTLKHRNTRTAESEKLIAGKLCLDTASRQVTYDGNEIQLTNREFILLQTLMENRSIVLSRDTLLTKVWGYDYIGETNVVDVYIYYLRSKIDDVFGEKIIETVRGAGYIIK